MKLKGFWYDKLVICLLAVFVAAFIGITAFIEPKIALCELAAALIIFAVAVYRIYSARFRYKKFMESVSEKLDFSQADVLSSYPFPVAVIDPQGYIGWCNGYFINQISGGELSAGTPVENYTNGKSFVDINTEKEFIVQIKERFYSVYSCSYELNGESFSVLYYLDITTLRRHELELFNSRPYALVIELDNMGFSRSELRDSERAEIRSRIEAELEKWAESHNSVLKKVGGERYLIFTEKKNFLKMYEDKFAILETVRSLTVNERNVGATLSIGVSSGSDIRECESEARKALDLALGRGGDQVVIKHKDNFDFFGGVSKSAEKKSRVASRRTGIRLSELIKSSSNVLVMGHAYSDLDAVGAAVGIASAARSLNVPVHIVTDRKKTLALPLVEMLEKEGYDDLFIGEDAANEILGDDTFVIVVDTHILSFFEFPAIYERASKKAIIDHHRRSVSEISDISVFSHDPGASSASEMVTEVLQYMGKEVDIPKPVAEALLSGIMLDTKNFVLRAGVRTFEAAAFLRRKGADTVAVKKLFSTSIDVNRLRNKVIYNAESYKNCAVSAADFSSPDIRIITSQAADELLNVADIKASFVMFESNGGVSISARSLGEINVQLIMESLGGGGHQTMAACQLKGYDIPSAKSALYSAIDDFFVKNS